MSGKNPRQQESRSRKDQTTEAFEKIDEADDLEVIGKEEAPGLVKQAIDSVFGGYDGVEPDDTTDQNGDGSSDDEEGED